MLTTSMHILDRLRHPNGLFSASAKDVATGYHMVWLRDNVYQALGLEAVDPHEAVRTYHSILDILLKHEMKIDWAIRHKPTERWQYIHARYEPDTLEERWEEWGNKQNDAIGAILFKIADHLDRGHPIVRDDADWRIIQKLVRYLESIEYWHDEDNGVWEENEEVHASSVGPCVAGLQRISRYVHVPYDLIKKGQETLDALLPRESRTKEVDLALLSLIYPYDIVTPEQRDAILTNVEEQLVREKGVIRYHGDHYYNEDGEAEWCFGFPWLAIIHKRLGDFEKYKEYLQRTLSVMNEHGELPELYLATGEPNENTPLGWGQALLLVALR